MIIFIVSLVILLIAVMVMFSQKQSVQKMKNMLRLEQEKAIKLEHRIESSKDELKKQKDELERKKSELDDIREQNRKKLKRFKELENSNNQNEAVMSDQLLEENRKTIAALEAALENLKQSFEQEKSKLKEEVLKTKENEASELKSEIERLKEDLKKQKRLIRPQGLKIELTSLSDEAASEFARLFRSAEQHKKLYGISKAKLHLAQEKFTTLQRRYFEVCRELALAMGSNESTDPVKARDFAEEVVAKHQQQEKPV